MSGIYASLFLIAQKHSTYMGIIFHITGKKNLRKGKKKTTQQHPVDSRCNKEIALFWADQEINSLLIVGADLKCKHILKIYIKQ